MALEAGDLGGAAARYEAGLALERKKQEPFLRSVLLGNLGMVRRRQGRLERARGLLGEAFELRTQIGDHRGAAEFLGYLGRVALDVGDFTAAAVMAEAMRTTWRAGTREFAAWTMEGVAAVAAESDRLADAARLFGAAERLRDAVGVVLDPALRADTERALGSARDRLGHAGFEKEHTAGRALTPDQAVAEALEVAEELAAKTNDPGTSDFHTEAAPG